MPALGDIKFSQFTAGGNVQIGDIVVGLRAADNYKFTFPGTSINDSSGNPLFSYATVGAGAINYLTLTNSSTGNPVSLTSSGGDTNVSILIDPKGSGNLILDTLTWPLNDGTSGQVLTTNGAGILSFATPSGGTVTNVSGTANRITVTNPTTTPVIDIAATYVGQTSVTTLGTITTGVWNSTLVGLAYGGSNKNMTPVAGGIVWTDADSMEVSAAGSAGQALLSGGTGAPTWSSATFPSSPGTNGTVLRSNGTNWVASTSTFADTYAINTLLYAASANAVSGLATAAQSVLTTGTGAAAPTWVSMATNGKILIGSTAGAPAAATLTAGAGVTITNGSNSVTIASSATGGGLTWSTIAGTTQSAAIQNGYVVGNAAQTTITLPGTYAVGDTVAVQGLGAGGWILTAAGGDTIQLGSSATSSGGSLTSTNQWDSVEVVCVVANTTWSVTRVLSTNLTIT